MTASSDAGPPVVSNSSPLIALAHVRRLQLLNDLLGRIIVPPRVAAEVAPDIPALPAWVTIQAPARPLPAEVLAASLGSGEQEALSLALQTHARLVLLDERPARRLAEALGLPVVGTLGLLLAAKRRGFLPAVKPTLDQLVLGGFRIAPRLLEQVLADAGE